MLRFWSNCKLGVKLQSAFALVMFIFVAAIIAIFAVDAKVSALNTVIEEQLHPARVAILRTELFARSADDDGALHTMELRPKQAAEYMVSYRSDLTQLNAELAA